MGGLTLTSPRSPFWYLVVLTIQSAGNVMCNTYHVGDLNGWGIPSSSNPQVYTKWSKSHNFTVGDTLFFLYPPSQDSVIQVTKESFDACNLKDPILTLDDGNSLFNITGTGEFYFTSGVGGHCQKSQKLHVSVGGDGSVAEAPGAAPAPSYTNAFGSIPMQEAAGSDAWPLQGISGPFMVAVSVALGSLLVM